jgi:hypothetical protein
MSRLERPALEILPWNKVGNSAAVGGGEDLTSKCLQTLETTPRGFAVVSDHQAVPRRVKSSSNSFATLRCNQSKRFLTSGMRLEGKSGKI